MFIFNEAAATGGGWTMILMIVVMVAVFYFLIMRPEKKKKKEEEKLRSSLKTGDKITTIGGIIGTMGAGKGNRLDIGPRTVRVRHAVINWAADNKGVQTEDNTK